MIKGHKETISIHFVSSAFMVLAIAIFKPFGLEMWQWQAFRGQGWGAESFFCKSTKKNINSQSSFLNYLVPLRKF